MTSKNLDINDQATVNGRPLLDERAVQRWIREVSGGSAATEHAVKLAATINECDFLFALWMDTPELKAHRSANQSLIRMRRIGEALFSLGLDLTKLLEDVQKIHPRAKGEMIDDVQCLIQLSKKLAPNFDRYKKRKGRRKVGWHAVAKLLAPLVVDALHSAGVKRAGFGKPTSAAVKVMLSALTHLKVFTSEEAVVDAMRTARARVGK